MKKDIPKAVVFVFLVNVLGILLSNCGKDTLNSSKSPIANAGTDRTIILPTDSILLDGSSSSDPDGKINEWLWRKISGPVFFAISSATLSSTSVKNLSRGIYLFELRVTDNGLRTAEDTVQITVIDPLRPNQQPDANAGADQIIILPDNLAKVNGSSSTDPDNNIVNYLWTKISGPSSYNIENSNEVQTQVSNLVQGIYQFELKVTDTGSLFAKDTIQIDVLAEPPLCDNSTRPQINARLIPFATRTGAIIETAVASGNKILFAGAPGVDYLPRPLRIDIYDTSTHVWSTTFLKEGRWNIAAVAAGNKIFFAGGRLGDGAFDQLFPHVNIYDNITDTWTVASLSEPRAYISAAAVGNKVFFAGGEKDWNYTTSNKVDIYDISTNTWSLELLNEARSYISAVAINNKIYFAGGHREDRWYSDPSGRIDIYDNNTNSWSVSSLVFHKGVVSSIAVNDKIYWAAGCQVEIKNVNSLASTSAYFSRPGGTKSVVKDGKIIFIEGGDKFDIYDIATNAWSIGVLTRPITVNAIISHNNTIYIAEDSQVWKLEF